MRHYIASQKVHHQKIGSATEFELLLKRHGFELRIDCASGVYAVPDGTRNSFFSISRHCRAGLQIVPSLRDWASPVGHRAILLPAYGNTNGLS